MAGSNTETVIDLKVVDKARGRVVIKAMVPPDIAEFADEIKDVTPVALVVAHALVSACSTEHTELGPILLGFEATLGMFRTSDMVDQDGDPIPLDELKDA